MFCYVLAWWWKIVWYLIDGQSKAKTPWITEKRQSNPHTKKNQLEFWKITALKNDCQAQWIESLWICFTVASQWCDLCVLKGVSPSGHFCSSASPLWLLRPACFPFIALQRTLQRKYFDTSQFYVHCTALTTWKKKVATVIVTLNTNQKEKFWSAPINTGHSGIFGFCFIIFGVTLYFGELLPFSLWLTLAHGCPDLLIPGSNANE